jgi:NAD(P)-dependent dehydrogenase (short-subunit alcohol dehydrogenase family)
MRRDHRRATANLFAKEGAQALYLLDLTIDSTSFDSLALQYPGTKCTVIECDAASEEAVQTVCEKAVEEYGRLDVFFANAG